MVGLVPVQSAGQRLPFRVVSPSLYQGIGSVSIRRSVSGLTMDRRINSRALSLFSIRAQQSDLKESLGVVASSTSSSVENDVRIKEWEVDIADSPSNILEEITWFKYQEVSRMKELNPLEAIKKPVENAPPTRGFVSALRMAHQRTGFPAFIAEVKKASASRGILKENFDPVFEIDQAYERGGAACLSALTDQKYFKVGFENLEAIRGAGGKFVVDEWQIYYARTKGTDAVLLIAAILTDLEITYLLRVRKMLGLAALVEVQDEREMGRVLGTEGIELVGINSRSLGNEEAFHGRQIREKDMIVVGESGLFTPDDIAYVQAAGVKAVLVGESIVKQSDPEKGIAGLFGRKISQT
ncbi:hypothetical protein Bca52824_026783 [Brassica carinata]|uniref:indole-3-glycerol-phosphate synthase n=1 Tax=Brassica carinata TaxID=52824 RepID=A0A8X7V892_BRACI|nr:hypothetical protein Bca52824_026783 [Brassica carinata]